MLEDNPGWTIHRSMASWSRSAARRLGRCTVQPSRWRSSAHTRAGWWRTPVSRSITTAVRPRVHSSPVNPLAVGPSSRACSTWRSRVPEGRGAGPLAPCRAARRCRWPSSGHADTHGLGGDAEPVGDLGLADAGNEELGRAEPAGRNPFALSLRRRAARNSWHACDPARRAAQLILRPRASSTRHPSPFSSERHPTKNGNLALTTTSPAKQRKPGAPPKSWSRMAGHGGAADEWTRMSSMAVASVLLAARQRQRLASPWPTSSRRVAAQWHPSRNGELQPSAVHPTIGTHRNNPVAGPVWS